MRSTSLIALAAALGATHALTAPSARADNAGGIVVTASRTGEGVDYNLLGGSVTLLDADALEQRQTRLVADILRDVPGVAVSTTSGLTQVRIRGTEANHTLVLIDGIEVSDPYQGEFDFSTLIADETARIEVLRGPQSALYGSDAIGGVIHYITAGGTQAPGVRMRAEYGSWNTANAAARVAGVTGDLDYAFNASLVSTDGTPDARGGNRDVGRDSIALSFKTTWSPAGNARIIAVGRYSWTDADYSDTDADPASPTFGHAIDTPGAYMKNEAVYGLVRGELDLLDGRWTHALSGQIADTRRKGYKQEAFNYGDKGRRTKASYETGLRFGNDALRHTLGAAVDVERERYRNLDPSGYAFTGARHTDNVGLVASYDLVAWERLGLNASLRYDDNDRFDDSTTYRVQGSYLLDTGTRLRASLGSGVKNPGFYELFGYVDGKYIGNPDLKPEKSEGWEAGIEQNLAEGAVLLGATWFDSTLRNEIFTDYPAPLFVATPANRDTKSKQHGIETYAQLKLGRAWRVDAAYTWTKAREDGVEEVRRPRHTGSLAVTWLAPQGQGSVTLDVRYNGRQKDLAYTDPSWLPVRVGLDDYTLVNLSGSWAVTPAVSLTARVENLLDKAYEDVFSFRSPGRGAFVGVAARF